MLVLVGVARQAGQALRAFARVFANPALRALQLAGIGSTLGAWAYGVAISVYAYHAGGAKAVGLICFARWAAAGALAPWVGLLVDRRSRRSIMVASDTARVAVVAGMAALTALDQPAIIVYVLAVSSTVLATAFPPAQGALLPSLVQSPEELTAANVVMSTVASVGMFAGPALGGLVLAVAGPSAVFVVTACTLAWSALCVLRIPADERPSLPAEGHRAFSGMLGGFRAVTKQRGLRIIVGLIGAQTFVAGAVTVLLVVVALRSLHAGNAGVGWLNAAFGVGCLLGVPTVAALAGRKRLAGDFGIGILLWGLPLALVPAWSSIGFVIVLFALTGIGNTLVDVAGATMLQRAADEAVLGRVFAVLESIIMLSLALGALVAPVLVSTLGVKAALIAIGAVLPALLVLTWRGLRAIDAASNIASQPLELLLRIPIFAGLPPPVLERLASAAQRVSVPAMTGVFAQGDRGDRFYAIASGRAVVETDGVEMRELGPGDFFGEIALLRDVPRTATVRALEELELYALERDEFIGAVTGHAPSREAADRVIAARLPAGAAI